MAFLSGWISLIVGFSTLIATVSMAFAIYLFQTSSIPTGENGWIFSLCGVLLVTLSSLTLTAIGVIVIFCLIHYHSLRVGSPTHSMPRFLPQDG